MNNIDECLLRSIHTSTLDVMLERNKAFAALQSASGTLMPSLPRALPNVKAVIIGCADMRVGPRFSTNPAEKT
jgi:carbonic anhydrase